MPATDEVNNALFAPRQTPTEEAPEDLGSLLRLSGEAEALHKALAAGSSARAALLHIMSASSPAKRCVLRE